LILDYRILSIGTLAVHELWERQGEHRTAHATTTLVRSGDRRIVVNPGLPTPVIAARLRERAGLCPEDISDVFLTSFLPDHRRGLAIFPDARWLISENERDMVGGLLIEQFEQEQDEQARDLLREDIALLKRFQAAPDCLAPHADLFPVPGFTPGACGLLLSESNRTVLVAGGAVGTSEHLEKGRVLRHSFDVEQAQVSFTEVLEIADVIVPGYDNVILNNLRSHKIFG